MSTDTKEVVERALADELAFVKSLHDAEARKAGHDLLKLLRERLASLLAGEHADTAA